MTLIHRQRLIVTNPEVAANFTAVDVWADDEGEAIKVRLSIIYNDLSNQEWWKDKKEKVLGTYLVQEGELVQPPELIQFGIKPFEMRAIGVKPIVFPPGGGPQITNKTKSLEVVRVEKSIDHYSLLLKNTSGKNVTAYALSQGRGGLMVGGVGYGAKEPLIAAGATRYEEHLSSPDIEKDGITIRAVVFEDGSFEGDPIIAAEFLARGEGVKLQLPHLLSLIERALEARDTDLEAAFEKLEAELWRMPEAIDKPSALELLKSKFDSLDEGTINRLYEELKGGLYEARNYALSPIGDIKRQMQGNKERFAGDEKKEYRAQMIRERLIWLRQDFERALGKQK